MCTGELQQLRGEKDIHVDLGATVPELRRRLEGWRAEEAFSSRASSSVAQPSSQINGGDKMRSGKCRNADCRWVLKNDMGYAQWA
eukprot:5664265-Pyramimonas_sp.AAC.1